MAELIQIPAQVMDFRPRADRSYRITFETQELSGEQLAILGNNFQGEGWLVFKPNGDIAIGDIPQTDADAGIESPSVKLRKRLWLLWKQQGKKGSFDNFYLSAMQKFNESVEARLEPEEIK